MMITKEQKIQFNDIIETLAENLDITESDYKTAVTSYKAIGSHLSKSGSLLESYKPEILPQGSFLIGTVIKPINELDDIDIDLVCQLRSDSVNMTQSELKQIVGDQLKENKTYLKLIEEPDGRRCWTLKYRNQSDDKSDRYHMDILPAVVASNYRGILNSNFSNFDLSNLDQLSIRITDKERRDYRIEKNQNAWLKSNPFGYAQWFYSRSTSDNKKIKKLLSEKIQEVPAFNTDKLELQRAVQILKRHRDFMFQDKKYNDDKPISIIITTLAAKAYSGETDVISALSNIIQRMPDYIESRKDDKGSVFKVITNPINPEENFADKWIEYPIRQKYFYDWLDKVDSDFKSIIASRGLDIIKENVSKSFGDKLTEKSFKSYGKNKLSSREKGKMMMAASTGILSDIGRTAVPQHQPYGKKK